MMLVIAAFGLGMIVSTIGWIATYGKLVEDRNKRLKAYSDLEEKNAAQERLIDELDEQVHRMTQTIERHQRAAVNAQESARIILDVLARTTDREHLSKEDLGVIPF